MNKNSNTNQPTNQEEHNFPEQLADKKKKESYRRKNSLPSSYKINIHFAFENDDEMMKWLT